jgi:hypothetical protein
MIDQSKPIGILFVHGIGTEKQGETLLGYSEPVFKWIARWLKTGNRMAATGSPAESIEVTSTELFPEDGAPAHSRWVMHLRNSEKKIEDTHWIAAESWWAETIVASNWRQTIDWAKQVVPSIVFFQVSNFVRRVFYRQEREFIEPGLVWLFAIPYAAFGFLLLLLINIVAFLLGILAVFQAVLPTGLLRSVTQSIQVIISHWVGDIFLILNSPIQRSAMVGKVKKDLEWMKKECSQIVIVAHSQGAAISYQILHEDKSPQIKGFVTLGSAIKLFKKVESLQVRGIDKRFVHFYNVSALFFIGSLLYFLNSWRYFFSIPAVAETNAAGFDWMNVLVSATPFVIVIIVLILLVQWLDPDRSWDPLDGEVSIGRDGFGWCDLYASNDPAPDGRLSRNPPNFLESRQVFNQANLVLDHTTYWENIDEFVSAVTVFLSEVTNTKFLKLTSQDADRIQAAKSRRMHRFRWLIRSRTLALASAIALLAGARNELPLVGKGILAITNRILGAVSSKISINLEPAEAVNVLGGITIMAIPLVWHLLSGWIWRWWQARDTEKLFRREAYESGGWPLRFMIFMTSFLFLGTAAFVSAPHRTVLVNQDPFKAGFVSDDLLAIAGGAILISVLLAALLTSRIRGIESLSVSILAIKTFVRSWGVPIREPEGSVPTTLRWVYPLRMLVDVVQNWAPLVLSLVLVIVSLVSLENMPEWMKSWPVVVFPLGSAGLAWWNTLTYLRANPSSYREIIYGIGLLMNILAYVTGLRLM